MIFFLIFTSSLLYYALYRYRKQASLKGQNYTLFFAKTVALLSSLFFLSLAVSSIVSQRVENYEARRSLFLLLDTSMSMGVTDAAGQKSRFSFAKEVANSLIDKSQGIPIALVAYQNEVQYVVPPTLDHFYLKNCIDELPLDYLDAPGTSFQTLFTFCNESILKDPRNKNSLFVLLTDGEDATEQAVESIEKPLYGMVEKGATLCAVAIGSQEGRIVPGTNHISRVNETFLQDIVTKGKGTLFLGQSTKNIIMNDYFKTYEPPFSEPKESFTSLYIGIALFFFVLFLAIPEVVSKVVLLLVVAMCPLQGSEELQTGFSYFEAGYYQLARNVFQNAFDASSRSALRAEMLTNIGLCYCYEGKFGEAKNTFQGIDPETFASQEAREKYFESFALALIKEAEYQLAAHQVQAAAALIAEAKKYVEQLSHGQKNALKEELYLVDAAKIKERCSLADVEGVLIQAIGTPDEQIYKEAVEAFLVWQGQEKIPQTIQELALGIDAQLCQQEIEKVEEPVKKAVDLILDAQEALVVAKNPFWKEVQKERTQFALKVVAASVVPYKQEAISLLQKNEIATVRHYIDLFEKPLGELFALAMNGTDPLAAEVLVHKVSEKARSFLGEKGSGFGRFVPRDSKAGSRSNFQSLTPFPQPENVARAWIVEDSSQAFSYFLKNDLKNLIEYIAFADQQKLLVGDPQRIVRLLRENKTVGRDGALFFLVYEKDHLAQKEWKEALQVLISFEKKAAAEQFWDEDAFSLSLHHIEWVKNGISEASFKTELEALLALEQSLGRDVAMQRYFHERTAAVLEKIATTYQQEVTPVDEQQTVAPEQEKYENIFSRLQEMEQDEKELRSYKEHETKDRRW